MGLDAWLTVSVLIFIFGMLVFTRRGTDMVMFGGLSILLVLGVVTPGEAFAGFSNQGVATVAILYVVAAGLRETGGIQVIATSVFRRPQTMIGAQSRLMVPVAAISAFLNNTPLVLMLLPVVNDWAKKIQMPASRLLIPLSFASLLGGMCTLIGTSTNLVVNGLLIDAGLEGLNMFDITWVGLPCAVVGIGFLLATGRWLLPDRRPARSSFENPREYTLEMLVEGSSPLVGKSIEDAGLRHLPGLYLMEIERNGEILPAVGPELRLHEDDRLVFVGVVDSVVDLQKIRGLKPATNQVFKLTAPRNERWLIESVVSAQSPFIGKTIRESRFRTHYDAVVIAVARNGARVQKKIGDIILQPGDTLLLEALPSFLDQQKNSRDFYLVSRIEDYSPPYHEKSWLALAILGAMVVVVTVGLLSMLQASVIAAGVMLATRCLSGEAARKAVDWRILITIAAAFGIGRALESSGAAGTIAEYFLSAAAGKTYLTLFFVYFVTMLFTEAISNNAAAVLMFPIARAAASELGADPLPFIIAIMIAASAGFATPIGYQTHLMVYGPGGYRFSDFLKIGVPMNLVIMATAMIVIPLVWPF